MVPSLTPPSRPLLPTLSEGICDFGRLNWFIGGQRAGRSARRIRTWSKIKSHRDRYERRHLAQPLPRICPRFLTDSLTTGVTRISRRRSRRLLVSGAELVYRIPRDSPQCRSRDALCWTLAVKWALASAVCRGKVHSMDDVGIYRRFHGKRTLLLDNHVRQSGMPLGNIIHPFHIQQFNNFGWFINFRER